MSMKSTCAISRRDLVFDSSAICDYEIFCRFSSAKKASIFILWRSHSRRKIHFFVERLEARIRTKRIVYRLHFEPSDPDRSLLVSFFEPVDGLAVLTQAEINQRLTKRSDETTTSKPI